MKEISGAIEGAKPGTIEVIMNPVLTGPVWTSQDATNSIVEYDVTATALSIGANSQVLKSMPLSKAGDGVLGFDLNEQMFQAGDVITIAAKASSTTIDAVVSMTWVED